jgi:thiamine pyrophosphate-dependent acetolactate synthase large subunit-like protein
LLSTAAAALPQVPTYKLGTAAFQEVPVVELFKPISKGAFYVSSASQVR